MSITSDPNLWVICALVFLLGLLIGVFLTAGGRRQWETRYQTGWGRREAREREDEGGVRRKWKTWYQTEAARREAPERDDEQHVRASEEREKEWRERDSLRSAAI